MRFVLHSTLLFVFLGISFIVSAQDPKAVREAYKAAISKANTLYKEKKYNDAAVYYKKAQQVKPGDNLSKYRLEDIITLFVKNNIASNKLDAERYIADAEMQILAYDKKLIDSTTTPVVVPTTNVVDPPKRTETEPVVEMVTKLPESVKSSDETIVLKEPEIRKIELPLDSTPPIKPKNDTVKIVAEKTIPVKKDEPVKITKIAEPVVDWEAVNAELLKKYPDKKTVEVIDEKTKKTTRVVMNISGRVSIYLKVEHSWGGIFYFIDRTPLPVQSISEEYFFRYTRDENIKN